MTLARVRKGTADDLTDSLDFLIRDTRVLLLSHIEERLARLGIPLRVWFPLRVLYKNEGITQRELGRMLKFGDAHAGVIVQMMQRHNLVERRQSQVDKRRIDLFLTRTGKQMARQTLRQTDAVNRRIVAGFSAADARALRALLLRAHDNLKSS